MSPCEAARNMHEVEGRDLISDRFEQNWFKRFNERDMSLKVKPRSGRPLALDIKVLRQAVDENKTTSIRKLLTELGPSISTTSRRLHQLGKKTKRLLG